MESIDSIDSIDSIITKEEAIETLYRIYNRYVNDVYDFELLYEYREELWNKGLNPQLAREYISKYHGKLMEIRVLAKDDAFQSYTKRIEELAKDNYT